MMKDKIVLITGPTSGIGEVTAYEMARQGARLALLARSPQKLNALVSAIGARYPNTQIDAFVADLGSLKSVREVIPRIQAALPRIDVLINNAGLMLGSERQESEDGFELTLAINHLGPFLLTAGVFDLLKKSPAARIINVSSAGHQAARPDFDNLQLTKGYSAFRAYCDSKLFNILFTCELHRRIQAQGLNIVTNSLHPGVVRTGFGSTGGPVMAALVKFAGIFMISAEKGAETTIYLASAPEAAKVSGAYFAKKQAIKPRNAFITDANERRLWELSEKMTGVKFL